MKFTELSKLKLNDSAFVPSELSGKTFLLFGLYHYFTSSREIKYPLNSVYRLGRFFQTSKYYYQKGYSRAMKGSDINVESEGTAKSAQGTLGFGLPKNQP